MDLIEHYKRDGHAIIRRLIAPGEVAELAAARDAAHAEALSYGRSYRHDQNEVPIVQWAARRHLALVAFRIDLRITRLLSSFVGNQPSLVHYEQLYETPEPHYL